MDLKGVVRIDYLVDQKAGKVYVNEVNTIPGSFAYYLWEPKGVSFSMLIDALIDIAYRQMQEKTRSSFAFDSGVLSRAGAGAKAAKA